MISIPVSCTLQALLNLNPYRILLSNKQPLLKRLVLSQENLFGKSSSCIRPDTVLPSLIHVV